MTCKLSPIRRYVRRVWTLDRLPQRWRDLQTWGGVAVGPTAPCCIGGLPDTRQLVVMVNSSSISSSNSSSSSSSSPRLKAMASWVWFYLWKRELDIVKGNLLAALMTWWPDDLMTWWLVGFYSIGLLEDTSLVRFSVLPSCQKSFFGLFHSPFQREQISTLWFHQRSIPPSSSVSWSCLSKYFWTSRLSLKMWHSLHVMLHATLCIPLLEIPFFWHHLSNFRRRPTWDRYRGQTSDKISLNQLKARISHAVG